MPLSVSVLRVRQALSRDMPKRRLQSRVVIEPVRWTASRISSAAGRSDDDDEGGDDGGDDDDDSSSARAGKNSTTRQSWSWEKAGAGWPACLSTRVMRRMPLPRSS